MPPRRAMLYLTCTFIALFALGCSKRKTEEEAADAEERLVTADISPVVNSKIQKKITASGVIFPIRQAAIVPKISAPVSKIHIERGDRVRAGQLLVELESRDLAGAATESRANYEQAQAAYEVASGSTLPEEAQKAELDAKGAKEALDAQEKVYESRKVLFKEGAISEKEVNEALVSVTQARSQYEIAQKHLEAMRRVGKEQALKAAASQVEAAKGRHESSEAQLSYSRIISPIDGVVADRPLFVGEMASSSAPIITIVDVSQVIVRTHISQREAAEIKVGNSANLSLPDQEEKAFEGKVTVVSPALDPGSTTVEVWVQAANPTAQLKPGANVNIQIVAETLTNALLIPAEAVLTSEDGSTSVMVVDSSNQPHRKQVTTGIRDEKSVQITGGLQSGERVVTSGAFELDKLDADVLAKTKVQAHENAKEEDADEGK